VPNIPSQKKKKETHTPKDTNQLGCVFQVIFYRLNPPNMAMENPPFEDVFPIESGAFSIVI